MITIFATSQLKVSTERAPLGSPMVIFQLDNKSAILMPSEALELGLKLIKFAEENGK